MQSAVVTDGARAGAVGGGSLGDGAGVVGCIATVCRLLGVGAGVGMVCDGVGAGGGVLLASAASGTVGAGIGVGVA